MFTGDVGRFLEDDLGERCLFCCNDGWWQITGRVVRSLLAWCTRQTTDTNKLSQSCQRCCRRSHNVTSVSVCLHCFKLIYWLMLVLNEKSTFTTPAVVLPMYRVYTEVFFSRNWRFFFQLWFNVALAVSVCSDIFGTGQLIHMNIYVMLTFLQPYISVSVGLNCAPAALL